MSTHVCPPRAPHVQGAIREDATLANITWLHHWGLTEDYPSSGWRKAHRVGKVGACVRERGCAGGAGVAGQGRGSCAGSDEPSQLPNVCQLLFLGLNEI